MLIQKKIGHEWYFVTNKLLIYTEVKYCSIVGRVEFAKPDMLEQSCITILCAVTPLAAPRTLKRAFAAQFHP